MNHKKFNNLIQDLQKIKMTSDEKSAVLKRSLDVIEKIEATHLVHSSAAHRVVSLGSKDSVKGTIKSAWYSYFFEKKFVPAFTFALLLLATGGTSLAAEGALPGDLLYPIKIGVNEQVRGLTAVTPEAKAKFALEITDRRLKEVALLSSKGLLNAETSAIVQTELLKQAGQIKNQVASLVSTKKLRAAQEISLNFESSLRAHELILEQISNDQTAAAGATSTEDSASSTDTTTLALAKIDASKIHIHSIITTLKNELATTTASRTTIQAKEISDESKNADEVKAQLAELKLKVVEIKRLASTTPLSLERSSSSLSYINYTDILIQYAAVKIESKSYTEALELIQKASQFLIDAETLITADNVDPVLKKLIDAALSITNFSTATMTPSIDITTSSTTSDAATSTATSTATTSGTGSAGASASSSSTVVM